MNYLQYIGLSISLASSVLCFTQNSFSQNTTINTHIDGTLLSTETSMDLVILIGDSGPVDRNGNQGYNRSNYLKKLADSLIDHNIASFRFDKRIVKQLRQGVAKEDVLFEDFVTDVKDIVRHFKELDNFESIYLIGHGQGSLIGILAASAHVNGLILLCGSGKNIGDTLIEQVGLSAPELKAETIRVVNQLKLGQLSLDFPPELSNAFNLDTQAFLISWMAYEPSEELGKLKLPVLIVSGNKDLQTPESEAQILASNCEQCQIQSIKHMNHVLVEIMGGDMENYKSYSDPGFSLSPELIKSITTFVNNN